MNNKPRKPLVAGILSLIQPGLGQVYNGEIRKAFIPFGSCAGVLDHLRASSMKQTSAEMGWFS